MEDKDFNANDIQPENLEPVKPANNKRRALFIIGGICLALCILLGLLAFFWSSLKAGEDNTPTDNTDDTSSTSASTDVTVSNTEVTPTESLPEATEGNATLPSVGPTTGSDQTPEPSDGPKPDDGDVTTPVTSAAPYITEVAQMSDNLFVVAGYCSLDTEKIVVTGDGVTATEIVPAKGATNNYFMGTVAVTKTTRLMVQAQEKDHALSEAAMRTVSKRFGVTNLMTATEYMPVFGKDSRIHFYSALLAYSLSDVIGDSEETRAITNISTVVNQAKQAGSEVIYFVVPSSASVYPETIPDGYAKAAGETVFDVFNRVATQCGAKVIYPLDTMLAHKNDGEGLKIYHHTDSHWSPYGAFWGIHDLMNYISEDHPEAKPRTVEEMGFYTKELWGGDALFSFADKGYFETNLSQGKTSRTKINELTALYKKKMPTSTLLSSYRDGKGVYSARTNANEATVQNPNGAGLPTAYIIRDSFGDVAYDMINDRFSTVWWQQFNILEYDHSILTRNNPDYVIYIISERNLIKIMANNSGVSLLNYL